VERVHRVTDARWARNATPGTRNPTVDRTEEGVGVRERSGGKESWSRSCKVNGWYDRIANVN